MNGNQGVEGLLGNSLTVHAHSAAPVAEAPAEAPARARRRLFGDLSVPRPCDEVSCRIVALTHSHGAVISRLKSMDSKVGSRISTAVGQLIAGTFVNAYDWDPKWVTKVANRFPFERIRFKGVDDLLNRVSNVLDYCEDRKPEGFWYPRTKNGKVQRDSLADFLVSFTKSGTAWSPFVELLCVDCVSPRMLEGCLSSRVLELADGIYDDCTWWSKTFASRVSFLRGVIALEEWYSVSRCDIVGSCEANRVHLQTFTSLLLAVRGANRACGCVYPTFITDNNESWSRFSQWACRELKMALPKRMYDGD